MVWSAEESELESYPHVFLTYVSENLKTPASAFGHVFLTFSKTITPKPSSLAVGFSARVEREVSTFGYLYRGVSGGFMGTMTVEPLYRRIHEYNRVEQRNLIFFRLDLSESERKRLLHELSDPANLDFPYYFFTDNCARRIDEALRLATGITSSGRMPYLLPRDVLGAHASRFREVYVCKASGSRVNDEFQWLTDEEQSRANRWLQGGKGSDSELTPRAREFVADLVDHDFRSKREMREGFQLAESQIFEQSPWVIPAPEARPEPLRSERVTFKRFKSFGGDGALRFEIRPAMQDFLDLPDAWGREMEFSILKTEFALPDQGGFLLENLSVVRLRSFGESGYLLNRPFAFSFEFNRKNNSLSLTPEMSGGYGFPLTNGQSVHSALLAGAGVVTAVNGVNGFLSLEWNSIVSFGRRVRAVKTVEARQFFGQGALFSRLIFQIERAHFRLGVGPDYETTSRKGSLVLQVSASF